MRDDIWLRTIFSLVEIVEVPLFLVRGLSVNDSYSAIESLSVELHVSERDNQLERNVCPVEQQRSGSIDFLPPTTRNPGLPTVGPNSAMAPALHIDTLRLPPSWISIRAWAGLCLPATTLSTEIVFTLRRDERGMASICKRTRSDYTLPRKDMLMYIHPFAQKSSAPDIHTCIRDRMRSVVRP